MTPVLQEILHNITSRLAALEQAAQSDKLLIDLIQEQRAEIDRLRAEQPEQVITPISRDQYERVCFRCGACVGKPWVGLTIDESSALYNKNYDFYATDMPIGDFLMIQREIEAKLKEKNT